MRKKRFSHYELRELEGEFFSSRKENDEKNKTYQDTVISLLRDILQEMRQLTDDIKKLVKENGEPNGKAKK